MYEPSFESFLPPHNFQPLSLQANTPKMCTPWTLRRRFLVGHKSNDSRLNLSNSRFQLEDDPNKPVFSTIQPPQSNNTQPSSSTASPTQDRATTALITRHDHPRNNETALAPSRISVIKRGKHKRKVTIGSNQTSSSTSSLGDVDGGVADEIDWPPFTDEDYIVFCFEEGGEFHVVMDENSKSQDCFDHGNSPRPLNQKFQGDIDNMDANRRDCFLPNKAVEEERFYFSPRLQSDGIKSLTRFKAEVDFEDMKIVKARGRVDEGMDYEDMDGIKRRGVQCNEEEEEEEDISYEDDLEFPKTSMECRDGSVESTGSSQSDWVRQLQVTKTDQELGLSSSSQAQDDPSSSKNGKFNWVDDEESLYLSSESRGGSQGFDEHSNDEESAETIDTCQLEEDEEAALDSAKSICSTSSSSSFEFPVLQWDSIGSPVKWPKSHSIRLRKPKSRRVCLRCCRF